MSSCENPQTEKDALMSRRPKFDKSKGCIRCKERIGNIVIRHAVYCKECFLPHISTRFRKTLEPSVNAIPDGPRKKALKAAGNLLVGFSGGLGSTVLLDLVCSSYFSAEKEEPLARGGKDHPRKNKVWEKAGVCYVEVCGAFPGMKDRTEDARKLVERYGERMEFVPLRLEDAFDERWWKSVGGTPRVHSLGMDMANENLFLTNVSSNNSTPVAALQNFISSLPTQTAVSSAINTLTRILLIHTAAARGCSHLLLGTSLTSLSISLISGIAQGSGFSVREEAQEEWTNSGDDETKRKLNVRIVRPLRDVGMKECAIWAWWMELRVIGRERYAGGKQGVGALTRAFIMGLERDYPSTVSTIARTCAKLAPKEGSEGVCVLCERPAQSGVQAWKSRISIRSHNDVFPPSQSDSSLDIVTSLTPFLCYACHTTLTSRSSRGAAAGPHSGEKVPLPVWVEASIAERVIEEGLNQLPDETATNDLNDEGEIWSSTKMGEKEMNAAIGKFLLED